MAITPRILLVDDIKTNLKIYKHVLADEGYAFYSYTDPEEALEHLTSIQPHLLILDIEMPKMDGIQLLKAIREKYGSKNIPVIFITTLSNEIRLKEAYEVGANDILSKDFKPFQLKFKVKSLLQQFFLEQKLMIFGRQMREKSEENENLIRILCHDLLNPLTALKLLSKRNKDERSESITDKAIKIIEHVREMLALEAGKKELKLTDVNLRQAIEESLEYMKEKMQKKNIQYFYNSGLLEDVIISAEKVSLVNQVLNNIISNAIKFSEQGGNIYFNTEVSNNQVYLKIRDEGIGIPKRILPDLFNKYVKTSRPGTAKETGTGFGLPIVKTYMNFYGGDVKVETKAIGDEGVDEDNQGTTFILTFNLVEVESENS